MSDRKTATTIDEQLTRLKERGMVIDNIDHANKTLLSVGYYRMGFYWYKFEIREYRKRGIHKFRKDTTWNKVEALYDFDDRFRNILSFYLQTIETDIRTYITYIVSNHYKTDPTWFINNECVKDVFAENFRRNYDKLKKNDVIRKHHLKHPEDTIAPAWKTLEFLTFGEVQYLYNSILDESLRKQIFSRYNIKNEDIFISYINTLREIRNVCAHSHILYDIKLYHGIRGDAKILDIKSGEEFNIIGVIKLIYYMLRIIRPAYEEEMRNAVKELVNRNEFNDVHKLISRIAF